jgi:hypothetical protein
MTEDEYKAMKQVMFAAADKPPPKETTFYWARKVSLLGFEKWQPIQHDPTGEWFFQPVRVPYSMNVFYDAKGVAHNSVLIGPRLAPPPE